ncbi:hypothetical protein V8B55DRAFT_1357487 [Mucor lusitanicus]|uniref:Uncharacterized protein n=2 Tax=Mucor circinelloides f. lusitanicus TaxID=29924 RepID=A0A162TM94_MUCCL|nr:hypothetical protein FB192DRAFT_1357780 [Mucor lusitanicus]OAD05602.1 hypothetical protein MUCCIDRAFT_109471 [Mucor lusitanicus CBS 277.49]
MSKTYLLSDEILILIMSHVGSLSQLRECRLVCKAWRNPGLISMLGQEITLRSELGIFRLYDLLMRDPSRGYLVKHLVFNTGEECSVVLKELLYLILTPNIETIKGDVSNDDFYIEFNKVMKRWPNKFEKFQLMTSCSEVTLPYFEALCHFKNSLQAMVFNIGEYSEDIAYRCAKDLSQFLCLTSLKMEGWYQRLWSMEEVLKYCPYLQELSLNIHEESGNVLESLVVEDWAKSTVEPQYNLKTLSIQTSCHADYLQYLFFKYPNIESIDIDIELDDDYIDINMHRITQLIKRVSHKHIVFTVGTGLDFREIVQDLQAYNYTVMIDKVLMNGDFRLNLTPMM